MAQLLREFELSLKGFDTAELDGMDNVVYAVDAEWRLAYLNPAWQRFARDNGGEPAISGNWGLGRPLLEAIPVDLKPYYRTGYQDCRTSGKPWHHEFECSSPSTFRRYQQTVYPLDKGSGLLIVNALVCEHPLAAQPQTQAMRPTAVYADTDDIIHQCCHCRRISHPGVFGRWDWVPALVEAPSPRTSHSLCAACLDFFYPDEDHDLSNSPAGEKQ
jgi:hypothetical protein